LLADPDENYLEPLEWKLAEEFQDNVEIIVITNRTYFEEYFSTKKSIGIAILNHVFYSEALNRHDITHLFILTEEDNKANPNREDTYPDSRREIGLSREVHEIYKYTGVSDIYKKLLGSIKKEWQDFTPTRASTRILMVYSPIGGSGKTTVAVGISELLASENHRVLYLNTENHQALKCFTKQMQKMPGTFEKSLWGKDPCILEQLDSATGNGSFPYLLPLRRAAATVGISLEHYLFFLEKLKEHQSYEYVIVDMDCALRPDTCRMMNLADKVIIVAKQDLISAEKIDLLIDNIDCSDTEKFVFLCNQYEKMHTNHLLDGRMKNHCMVKYYINRFTGEEILLSEMPEGKELNEFVYGIL